MRRSSVLAFVFVFSLSAALSPCLGQPEGKRLTRPIVIDPSVAALENAHAVKAEGRKFFVVGKYAEGVTVDSVVGYTRTGRQTVSPILCNPGPAEALRLTVANALAAQGILAASAQEASFVIDVAPELKLTEVTKKIRQTVVAELKVAVAVWDVSDPNRVKKFKMEAAGERSHVDTSKQAELAAREALRTAAGEILKSLDSL